MFLALALLAGFAPQADPRYELGWRLKALEQAWQEERSPAVRTGLLPCWERATQGFFSGRTDLAAQAMDEARARLAGREPGWWESLALTPEARLIDATTASLELELTTVYEARLPPEFELVLSAQSWRAAVTSLPWKGRVPLAKGAEGLHTLTFELRDARCRRVGC